MTRNINKSQKNLEYANRWLNRAIKDFNLFKLLVPFDRKTRKPVKCSDPALAVYLLQQSVEKAVKATALASQQYEYKDLRKFGHNSLALIINLNNKMVEALKNLGLDSKAALLGLNIEEGEQKLSDFDKQLRGEIKWLDKNGEKVKIDNESRSVTPELIDIILDTAILSRKKILEIIRVSFGVLSDILGKQDKIANINPEMFAKILSEGISKNLNVKPLDEDQLKFPFEVTKQMNILGLESKDNFPNRKDTITNYLGVWAFSYSLLWLTYLTFSHESTSRYPLKNKGDIKKGRIGCDDYDDNLGIVNRIGRIGYATNLTLNEMKNQINTIGSFFSFQPKQN